MTCVLLALLFIRDENSFDAFHEKGNNIYRITTKDMRNHGNTILGTTGQVQGPAFKASIPEVTAFVRVWLDETHNIIVDKKKGFKVSVTYADDNFFEIFSFPLLHGDSRQALRDINSIVISEEMALKFFGETDVVGRTLGLEDGPAIERFLITGVAKNLPANSSLKFQAVVPFKFLQRWFDDDDWAESLPKHVCFVASGQKPGATESQVRHGVSNNRKEADQESQDTCY